MSLAISIIIPVFNIERYLTACLDSIVHQINDNVEVIIVNDGSTDDTDKIADQYAINYDFIKVIHQSNQGVSAARNRGLLNAAGDYIWFVDGDDLIADNALYSLMQSVDLYNVDVVFFSYQNFYHFSDSPTSKEELTDNNIIAKSFETHLFKLLKHRRLSYSPCDKITKRQLLLDHNISFKTNLIAAEDYFWNFEVFQFIHTFTFIDKAFYKYRKGRLSSATTIYNQEHLYSTLNALELSIDLIAHKSTFDSKSLLLYSSQLFFYNLPEFYKSGLINYNIEKRFYDIYQIYEDNNIELIYFNSGAKIFKQLSLFIPWRYSIRIYSQLINIRRFLQLNTLKKTK